MTDSPTDPTFPSKRDSWLVVVLWATIVMLTAASALAWLLPATTAYRVGVSLFDVAIVALLLSVLYGTNYTVAQKTLRIRSGPFRWSVPVDEIRSITPTRNPLSSPACSLDRLEIAYGSRALMVSPDDKAGFLAAMAERTPGLEVSGERALRR